MIAIYDLGPFLYDHTLKIAVFSQQHQSGNNTNNDNYCATLLAASTIFDKSSPNDLYDSASTLMSAWYTQMKTKHEELIEEKIKDEAEECEEISSLFSGGACAGRSQLPVSELESLLKNGATLCGLPLLMKADFKPYIEHAAADASSSSTTMPVSDVTKKILLRAWADVHLDSNWFLRSVASPPNGGSSLLKNVFYSVSPDLVIKFRVAFPAFLKSELDQKQVIKYISNNNNNNGNNLLLVFRDVSLTFDDDDVMPGDSIQPMVKKFKEYVALFGITSQQLQRALVKLQKLVDDSMSGLLDQDNSTKQQQQQNSSAKSSKPVSPTTTTTTTANQKQSGSVNKASIAKLYTDPENALKDVDLNDADDVTVQEYKDKMTEKFQENVLKPGDPGYVYDKRIDAPQATAKSEWDDSDDD